MHNGFMDLVVVAISLYLLFEAGRWLAGHRFSRRVKNEKND